MSRPGRRRKILVASIGVATVSYVVLTACRETPISGNLPAPPPPTDNPPVVGNLPAPPPPEDAAAPDAAIAESDGGGFATPPPGVQKGR
jgi:hypothetical protein